VTLMKPCLVCGEVSEGRRCPAHTPSATALRRSSAQERGYDAEWQRLSRRARRLQPWCSDCGTEEGLTADHLPSAWDRKARGLVLRLEDVDVVCGPCNVRRGSSRPGSERGAGMAWGDDRRASRS